MKKILNIMKRRKFQMFMIILLSLLSYIDLKDTDQQHDSDFPKNDHDDPDGSFESVIEEVDDTIETRSRVAEAPAMGRDAEEDERDDEIGEEKKETNFTRVETFVFFPDYPNNNLVAGKEINLIAGLRNKGNNVITVESIEASFRYPQDYSYFVQNFTTKRYNVQIEPKVESSFQYTFLPHESYGGRLFGVSIIVLYRDDELVLHNASVFNETITIKELDVTFDLEEFFLLILLIASASLIVFGLYYHFVTNQNKATAKNIVNSFVAETGTNIGKKEIDYDWLPKETTTEFQQQTKSSPRKRGKGKRNTWVGVE